MIAGLTAAAVVIPTAMAYATVTGLPVEVGLYTAFVPMLVYALLGRELGHERMFLSAHDALAAYAARAHSQPLVAGHNDCGRRPQPLL